MIREFRQPDMGQVIRIWLEASIQAHDFIDREFWESKAKDMRNIYIPSAETYVFEQKSIVRGFISLSNDTLAAIFVSPDSQGKGIGTQLMRKAKGIRDSLTLTVYKDNVKSMEFYRRSGFRVEEERIDQHTGHRELVMRYTP